MGLASLVREISQQQLFWAHSIPATYAQGANQVIFNITGGPVWIRAFVEYNDTLVAAATTTTVLVGAVGLDTGAQTIAGAAGTMVVSPLDAAVAKLAAPALAVQMPSLLGFATNIGVVASPGVTINITFAAADMGVGELASYYCAYYKMASNSLIA